MFAVRQQPVHVYWCAWCGGSENEEPTCPTCHRRKSDLGWKVGDSYYSAQERLPKASR